MLAALLVRPAGLPGVCCSALRASDPKLRVRALGKLDKLLLCDVATEPMRLAGSQPMVLLPLRALRKRASCNDCMLRVFCWRASIRLQSSTDKSMPDVLLAAVGAAVARVSDMERGVQLPMTSRSTSLPGCLPNVFDITAVPSEGASETGLAGGIPSTRDGAAPRTAAAASATLHTDGGTSSDEGGELDGAGGDITGGFGGSAAAYELDWLLLTCRCFATDTTGSSASFSSVVTGLGGYAMAPSTTGTLGP